MWMIGVIVLTVTGIAFATWKKKELPRSMSAVVYDLPSKWRGLWSVWIWLIMVALSKPLLEAMPTWWEGLIGFALLATIGVIGALPLMPMEVNVDNPAESRREQWHMKLSVLAGFLSQLCVARINAWWLLLWLLLVVIAGTLIVGYDNKTIQKIDAVVSGKGVLLLEVIAVAAVCGCLFF